MSHYSNHPLYSKHTLDTAMSSLWTFYKSHFLPLFIISFIFTAGSAFVALNIDSDRILELAMNQDREALSAYMKEMYIYLIPSLLISIFGYTLISLYILQSGTGKANYLILPVKSLLYLLTLTIIIIVFTPIAMVVVAAGLLALLIGVLFSVLWLSALFVFFAPLLMNEGNNITHTIVRSFRLMHRHFGASLGWTAVVIVIILLLSLVVAVLSLIPFNGISLGLFGDPEASGVLDLARNPGYIIFASALKALIFPLFPIFGFILYFNAKAWEDDPLTESSR